MQQTQNLKLNLIETDDPLSPAPLNENINKLEAALNAVRAEAAAGDASLDSRITVLEAKHMVVGKYVGTGADNNQSQTIALGFTPMMILVKKEWAGGETITITDVPICDAGINIPEIVPDGFLVNRILTRGLNTVGTNYYFFAIG